MRFDEVLVMIGPFGIYQKRIFGILMLPATFIGSFLMMTIVVLYTPKHRCKIPGLDNDTYAIQSPTHELLVNTTIPGPRDPTLQYDQCHIYTYDTLGLNSLPLPGNNSQMEKCTEWVYDKSVFKDTFTTKANLVCDDSLKIAHIMMLFYFGVLVGDFILGMLADIAGRKIAMYVGFITLLISSICVTFAPEFYSFAILQFITGGAAHGIFVCIAVLGMEIVGAQSRVWTGTFVQMFFAVGVCYLALMAYLIRSWAWINLSVALPCVIFLSYWWIIPESPRWLISKGRLDESLAVIKRAAVVNKVQLPADMTLTKGTKAELEGRIWHVLRSPVLLKRTLILAFNWAIISMTYYGVTMNAGNLSGSFYLNFLLMGVAEFPGYFSCLVLLDRIGRRLTNAGAMIVCGLACLATMPVVLWGGEELSWLTIVFSFIGKAGSSAAFAVVYIFTAEMLPTVVRNAAMGTCSCAARIGAMLAPYIAKSGEMIGGSFGKVEPLVVFGALSIIAGLLLLLLPETLNQVLPDTMEEGERFGRKTRTMVPVAEELVIPDQNGTELKTEYIPFIQSGTIHTQQNS